ncbi:MAG TPA: zinc-dependent alcohol dehydrogenase family protein [Candidatus Tectomicrobia bacterium]|nr:zinc-dependent alcohol dehydrogenase family protein [Candidatus Tectomicrobia bacterium]
MALRAPGPIEDRPLRPLELPDPVPAPGEIVVAVTACAMCRTDLHVVEGELPQVRSPLVPGHQVVGRVVARGRDATRFQEGDRVGIAWLRWTCNACRYCATDRENLCDRARFTGYHADGGYAEYALVDQEYAYPIPPGFSDVQAAPLLCAGIIGYRALRLTGVRQRDRLALYGFGSSAHVTIQIARARGIEVYVCTREPSHRELALSLGAAWAGDIREPLPRRAEGAILFAPAGELVPVALRNLARGGTLACAGIYMTPIPAIDYGAELFQERTVRSVTANTRSDGQELLAEAVRIPVRVQTMEFPLDIANEALELLKRGAITGTGVLLTDEASRV